MPSATIVVRSSKELHSAVEKLAAGLGGTILLDGSAGPFALDLVHNRGRIDAAVRITSLDADDPATLTSLRTIERENLTVDGVVFDSSDARRGEHHRDVEFIGSTGMTIADSAFRGGATEALDGTPGQVKGATMALVRSSTDVSLIGNTVEGYYHGVTFMDSSDLAFVGNEMTRLQGDGIRIAGAQDLLIEGNQLHDMLGSSQDINHSDMIQFWGANIRQNTERVTIRDNVLLTGDGPAYQMIFGRNEHKAHNGWLFQDIVIEGNLIHGAHHNMISVAQTEGMVVRHNTVLWNPEARGLLPGGERGGSVNGWVRAPDGHGTVIENNVATHTEAPKGKNAVVGYGSASDAGHFDHHFVNLGAHGTADLRDLCLVPGSAWDGVMGAPMTWSSHIPDGLQAIARAQRSISDRSLVTLDAGLSRDGTDRLDEGRATYVWTFDDGTRKRGPVVSHDFGDAGVHRYALEVRTPDGAVDRIERSIAIADPELLRLAFEDGRVRDASSYGSRVRFEGEAPSAEGFTLDGASRIEVVRGAAQLHSLDQFALDLTFTPEGRAGGTLFELLRAMEGRLTKDGALVFDITTTKGTYRASTDPGAVTEGRAHDLRFVFDGVGQKVEILVDGERVGTAAAFGITKPVESWGLVIGNLFGGTSAKGLVAGVSMHAEPYAAPDESGGETDPFQSLRVLAHLTFDDGVQDVSGRGAHVEADASAVEFALGSSGMGRAVEIGGRGDAVTLSRANAELFDRDEFHIAFDLKRDPGGESGRVLTLPRTLDLTLRDDGRLAFALTTDEGTAIARTKAPVVAGADWHRVELAYDGGAGVMQVVVDGAVAAEAELTGRTAPARYWGLTLGRPWGGEADGAIDEFVFYEEAFVRDTEDGAARAAAGDPRPAGDARDPAPELADEVGHLMALTTVACGDPAWA